MHVLNVVVIRVVVCFLETPVDVALVGPVVSVLALWGVVRVNDISAQLWFEILAAFAGFVTVHLLQLVWLQHIQLGLLLHVGRSQVLFGVVVAPEGSALSHVTDSAQDEQENQEQNPAHDTPDYSAQGVIREGGPGRGREQGFTLVCGSDDSGGAAEDGCSSAGRCGGGGRI